MTRELLRLVVVAALAVAAPLVLSTPHPSCSPDGYWPTGACNLEWMSHETDR